MFTFCHQFNCKGVPLNHYDPATNETVPQAWWTGRKGDIHFYWHSDGRGGGSEGDNENPLADGCACSPVSINIFALDLFSPKTSYFPHSFCKW